MQSRDRWNPNIDNLWKSTATRFYSPLWSFCQDITQMEIACLSVLPNMFKKYDWGMIRNLL
jgi:hypothetical protein